MAVQRRALMDCVNLLVGRRTIWQHMIHYIGVKGLTGSSHGMHISSMMEAKPEDATLVAATSDAVLSRLAPTHGLIEATFTRVAAALGAMDPGIT